MNLDLVIFDMDGVIFDSEKVYYEANQIAADKLGMDYSLAYYKQFIGAGDAAGGRCAGLHSRVGPWRCGHRPDDHLQPHRALSAFRRGH